MKRVIRLSYLACAAGLVATATARAAPATSVQEIMSGQVGAIRMERTSLSGLLEKVGLELRTPIRMDRQALEAEGHAPGQSVGLDEPAQTADQLLLAVLKRVDRDDRFCFTVAADEYGRIELLFTSRRAAQAQGLLVVPREAAVDPKHVRVSFEFEKNTLENGLLFVCMQIGANLRLDDEGLTKAGIPITRQFGVKFARRSASSALDDMLKRFDPSGSTTYLFAEGPDKKPVLVVGTKDRLEKYGPRPALKNFQDIAERTPPSPSQVATLLAPLRRVADALAKPVGGGAGPLSFEAALANIARTTGLPIEISFIDLETAGVPYDQSIDFDPQGRAARAVLYDVLLQADPKKAGTLVACFERREDDAFVLIVTTRSAANSAGRSLLADYNLSPDDIK